MALEGEGKERTSIDLNKSYKFEYIKQVNKYVYGHKHIICKR